MKSKLAREEKTLLNLLGWVSLGLGVAQIIMPRRFSRLIGAGKNPESLVRTLGLREVASGAGIFSDNKVGRWVRGRIAGDAMDLLLLALSRKTPRANLKRLAGAGVAVLGVTALDLLASHRINTRQGPRTGERRDSTVRLRKSIIIERSPEEVYSFWHNFENLPRIMEHLESVEITGNRRSHWRARGPGGIILEWDAEMTDDRPNELIGWHSLPNANVENWGYVHFAPARSSGPVATELRVEILYRPFGGSLGSKIADAIDELALERDLRMFKQLLETGEIASTKGQPSGPPRYWVQ